MTNVRNFIFILGPKKMPWGIAFRTVKTFMADRNDGAKDQRR